jgi:hypothetical protein
VLSMLVMEFAAWLNLFGLVCCILQPLEMTPSKVFRPDGLPNREANVQTVDMVLHLPASGMDIAIYPLRLHEQFASTVC